MNSKPAEKKKDDRLHICLTAAEREGMRRLSEEVGTSMSGLARFAIRQMLRRGLIIPGFEAPKPK